jgi:translation initiation factor IF-1
VPKGDLIDVEGVVVDALGGGQYSVQTNDTVVRARLAGKLKKHHIRVLPGDKVRVSLSPYDMSHGMVTFRFTQSR